MLNSLPSALTYGLGRKLVLTFSSVLILFVTVAFAVNLTTQRNMIEERLETRSTELSKLLIEISSSYLFDFRVSELEIILEDVQRQPDIDYVRLIDPEGFVLASGTIGDNTFLTIDDEPSIAIAKESGETVISETDGIRHLTLPIAIGGQYLGTMRLGISLAQYQSDISLLQYRNASVGAAFIALGALVSVLMSQRLTRPLRRLIELTRSARNGDLDQSLELTTNDEIETLAAEFGEMLRALKTTMGEINRLAYVDSLTGLKNRAWFSEYLNSVIENSKTEQSAIMFLDLDRFKSVNDTHGHDVGDAVLCEMSNRLENVVKNHGAFLYSMDSERFGQEASTRPMAAIARLGGDEFTIFLRDISDNGSVEALAHSIVATMRQPFDIGRVTFKSSVSVGIAFIPEHGSTAQDILKSADVAMYQAKKVGRNTYCIFDPARASETSDRRLLEQDLVVGIAEKQLFLQFQPQFDVISQKPVAAEALIRWQHPTAGLVPPDDFLPLADDAGLMGNIGRFVVTEGLTVASGWPKAPGQALRLAINLGVKELSNRDFVDFVLAELDRLDFEPRRLEIEVTEETAMEKDEELEANIWRLRKVGVRFAVDDFGIGYSNLSRLKFLQFETLKIDRSLIADVGENQSAEAVITSLQQLSHALNLEVVAEGVESKEQLILLQMAGCQFVQGFGLSRPLSEEDFLKFIAKNSPPSLFEIGKKNVA